MVMTGRFARATLWLAVMPILLFGSLLTFSRGAWINLAVSLAVYAFFAFGIAPTNRQRLKLIVFVVLGAAFAVGIAARLGIPRACTSSRLND
jgi:hypothetical protein